MYPAGEKNKTKQSETSEILYCVAHPHDAPQTENVTSSACCFSLPSAFPPLAWDALVSVARKDVRDKRLTQLSSLREQNKCFRCDRSNYFSCLAFGCLCWRPVSRLFWLLPVIRINSTRFAAHTSLRICQKSVFAWNLFFRSACGLSCAAS